MRGLRKRYGALEAVAGVDFEIEEGEVFGLLGPNGAGKTTTVEILEGYRHRDAGEVVRARPRSAAPGRDLRRAHRRRAPAVAALAEPHRARDASRSSPATTGIRATSHEVIELVGLDEKRDARVKTLSGGQKRRLDLGIALVGDPDLVFLDEPTTGFDPAARRAAWDMIRSLRSLGKTVLLTTHYLDEAEQLADRVAVLREGKIVRVGTPRELTTSDLEVEIRYRRNGEDVLVRTGRADSRAARAHRRGGRARRGARPARGAAADARGRVPGADREEEPDDVRLFFAPAPRGAARLLAQLGGGAVHSSSPMLLFVLLGSVSGLRIRSTACPRRTCCWRV